MTIDRTLGILWGYFTFLTFVYSEKCLATTYAIFIRTFTKQATFSWTCGQRSTASYFIIMWTRGELGAFVGEVMAQLGSLHSPHVSNESDAVLLSNKAYQDRTCVRWTSHTQYISARLPVRQDVDSTIASNSTLHCGTANKGSWITTGLWSSKKHCNSCL